jgi:hypothetical protein
MATFDPAKIYAEQEANLRTAQILYEQAIEAYGQAIDLEAEATQNYRLAKLAHLQTAKDEGYPASARAEVAKLKSHAEEAEKIKAEGQKNKCKFLVEAYKERCFNIRHLGNKLEVLSKQ